MPLSREYMRRRKKKEVTAATSSTLDTSWQVIEVRADSAVVYCRPFRRLGGSW
jgi:hypothetical protein